jgi:hypothetical protein
MSYGGRGQVGRGVDDEQDVGVGAPGIVGERNASRELDDIVQPSVDASAL